MLRQRDGTEGIEPNRMLPGGIVCTSGAIGSPDERASYMVPERGRGMQSVTAVSPTSIK